MKIIVQITILSVFCTLLLRPHLPAAPSEPPPKYVRIMVVEPPPKYVRIMVVWQQPSLWEPKKFAGFRIRHDDLPKPRFAEDVTVSSASDMLDLFRIQPADVQEAGIFILWSPLTSQRDAEQKLITEAATQLSASGIHVFIPNERAEDSGLSEFHPPK